MDSSLVCFTQAERESDRSAVLQVRQPHSPFISINVTSLVSAEQPNVMLTRPPPSSPWQQRIFSIVRGRTDSCSAHGSEINVVLNSGFNISIPEKELM